MLAKQFIAQLQSQGLLAPEIVEELNRQVAESKSRLTPEVIAKLLVDNGHLTKFQATKIIADLKAGNAKPEPAPEPPKKSNWQDEEELLGFADDPPTPSKNPRNKPTEQVAAVFLDDEVVEIPDEEVVDVDIVEEVIEVADTDVIEKVSAKPVRPATPLDQPAFDNIAPPSIQSPRDKMPKANPWDSFRILGVGFTLAVVVFLGAWLGWYFIRGSAKDVLQKADAAYEQQSYESAAETYKKFVSSFSSDPKVSYAKVRAALAQVRNDTDKAPDPNIALQSALTLLPPIAGESALSSEQGDLTGVLLNLAGKFNERADGEKETPKKKELMDQMSKLMEVINNPQFVGTTQRNQQLPTINRIEEDRQRILRDINRDEDLTKSTAEISEKLAAKQTDEAYRLRQELIDRYPQLETAPAVMELVKQATEIQKTLVTSVSVNFKLSAEPMAVQPGPHILLANRIGNEATALKGRTLFVRANGAVFGLEGLTGNVLWRQYVGSDLTHDPIRLQATAVSDLLVCRSDKGQFARLEGQTGKTLWKLDVGGAALPAVVDGADTFIALRDGTIASLDVETGQTKWSVKLPQAINTPPGIAPGRPLYVLGDQGNLYVLARQDGSCKEVYYLGHQRSTIVVAPQLILGQLFVFENPKADSSEIHILRTADDGLQLQTGQASINLKGNIVVPPQAEGRRLMVLTDLGEVAVLDIEPTSTKDKVTSIATIRASETAPRVSWGVIERDGLWTTSNRFARYLVLVSKGQLVPQWNKEPGDQFQGPPQKLGDMIVHVRTVRGTEGVRVTAVAATSGDRIWQNDIAVPISVISPSGVGNAYDAVTTSGVLFKIGSAQPIRNQADETPEGDRVGTHYANAEPLEQGTRVMLNESTKGRIAVYRPGTATKRLTTLAANISGEATCAPTGVQSHFAIGLNNGQMVIIDPVNGSQPIQPYQVALEAGKKTIWNQPVYLADAQSLVAYHNQQKLLRLGVGKSLRLLGETSLELPLRGPLVALGNKVLAIAAPPSGDSLQVFDGTSLKLEATEPLAERVISGPYSIAGIAVAQTDNAIQAFGADAKQLWSIDFANEVLLGRPVMIGKNVLLVSRSGKLWSVDPASGQIAAKSDVAQSLSATPLVTASRVLLGTRDGCVLITPLLGSEAKK